VFENKEKSLDENKEKEKEKEREKEKEKEDDKEKETEKEEEKLPEIISDPGIWLLSLMITLLDDSLFVVVSAATSPTLLIKLPPGMDGTGDKVLKKRFFQLFSFDPYTIIYLNNRAS